MSNDRVEMLRGQLEAGVAALVSSEQWQAWLTFASKMRVYSPNNQLLIMLQCPNATHVAGYRAWQAMGRQVKKGEKSLGILAPRIVKAKDSLGNEEKRVIGFHCVSVFDVSQTDGQPLPEQPRATLLQGEAPAGLWGALAAIVTANGYALQRGDCNGANGYTSPSERVVKVRDDVSDAQAIKTLCHELGHVLLHTDGDDLVIAHRGTAETEAESVAFITASYFGLTTDGYSFPYIASWSGSDLDLIKSTMQRVDKTAKTIIDTVEASLAC